MPSSPSAADRFAWSDAYALGYPQMDNTHREFVATVNTMLLAADEDLAAALDVFAAHAQRHFDEEANWMKGTNFPAAECHLDEHAAVMKSVHEVQALMQSLGPTSADALKVGRGLAEELVKWFPGHADYLDSALAQWMSKRSFGGAPLVFRRDAAGPATAD